MVGGCSGMSLCLRVGEFFALLSGMGLTGWVKSDKSTSKQAVCERYGVVSQCMAACGPRYELCLQGKKNDQRYDIQDSRRAGAVFVRDAVDVGGPQEDSRTEAQENS